MPTVTATENSFKVVPTADYLMMVTSYKEESGQFGPQLMWKLEIVKPDEQAGNTIPYWTGTKLTKGGPVPTKLTTLVESAFNRTVSGGEQVDTDNVCGRYVIASVVAEPRKDGNGDRNTITRIKPYTKQEPFPVDTDFEVGEPPKAKASDPEDPFGDE